MPLPNASSPLPRGAGRLNKLKSCNVKPEKLKTTSDMKKMLLAAALILTTAPAWAGHFSFGVSIGLPLFSIDTYSPPPVVYAAPPPVVYVPPPSPGISLFFGFPHR